MKNSAAMQKATIKGKKTVRGEKGYTFLSHQRNARLETKDLPHVLMEEFE